MKQIVGLFVVSVITVVSLLTASPIQAATRFEPLTLMMMHRYHRVAVVVAESSPEKGKVLFTRLQDLHGQTPETVVARLDSDTLETLSWGTSYVVAWTEIRRNPKDRDSPEIDPDGPKVVTIPVVGAALLDDTPEIRALFETAADRKSEPRRPYLEAILTQLDRPARGTGVPTQRFVITELYMRPQLLQHLRDDDLPVIRQAVSAAELGTEVRSFLLELALRLPGDLRGTWLTASARRIVAEADTELDLGTTHPLLVKTALRVLESSATDEDVALLTRHFASNSPGVAKAALAAAVLVDPEAAATRARDVLVSESLHQTTRQALEAFLRMHENRQSGS